MDETVLRYTTMVLAIAAGTASGLYAIVRVGLGMISKKVGDFIASHTIIQQEVQSVKHELSTLKNQVETIKEILYNTIEILEQNGPTFKTSAKKRALKK